MYETSNKVTQKLCQIAKCLGAIRLANGCYYYESILYSDRKLTDTLGLKVYDDNFANNAYIHKINYIIHVVYMAIVDNCII